MLVIGIVSIVIESYINYILSGVCRDSGQQYGMYAIHVTRHRTIGEPEIWVVPRRYSDFHDLQLVLKQTVCIYQVLRRRCFKECICIVSRN